MTREFKPGDVAELTFNNETRAIGVRCEGAWAHNGKFGAGGAYDHIGGFEVRPLLVLDPEDAEGVARLAEALRNVSGNLPIYADDVASALRSLLDPKPEEPKGHFAVVVDRNGVRWVNWRDPRVTRHHERPWVHAGDSHECREYADIDVTEVLSHGVPEDGAR
jgi:hypothetical protein